MRVSHAIVFVSDMQRSVAFYKDFLGVPARFESPEWTEFDTFGATLALHASDGPAAVSDGSVRNPAGASRPGLTVADLDEFHAKMISQGVTCLQKPTDLHGTRLAQYQDPDGLSISVSEERAG